MKLRLKYLLSDLIGVLAFLCGLLGIIYGDRTDAIIVYSGMVLGCFLQIGSREYYVNYWRELYETNAKTK